MSHLRAIEINSFLVCAHWIVSIDFPHSITLFMATSVHSPLGMKPFFYSAEHNKSSNIYFYCHIICRHNILNSLSLSRLLLIVHTPWTLHTYSEAWITKFCLPKKCFVCVCMNEDVMISFLRVEAILMVTGKSIESYCYRVRVIQRTH